MLFISQIASAQFLNPGDEFYFPCKDVHSLFLETDLDLQLNASSSISSPSFSYDPGTGELIFLSTSLTGPKSYGYYEFINNHNNQVFKVYIIACCQEGRGLVFDRIFIKESSSNGYQNLNGEKILVLDEFILDDGGDYTSCDFYFGADAKMTLSSSQTANFLSTNLQRYCPERWDGFFASGSTSTVDFQQSLIEGSARGFKLNSDVNFSAYDSEFINNQIGIGVFSYTANGPYDNNSYINLDENYFDVNSSTIAFASGSTISMAAYTVTNGINGATNDGTHIYVQDSEISIGETTNGYNLFEANGVDNVVSIMSYESTVFIARNQFSYNGSPHAVVAELSILKIGGGTSSYKNIFTGAKNATLTTSHFVGYNDFTETNTTLKLPTNSAISGVAGTYFIYNDFDLSSTTIYGDLSVKNVFFEFNTSHQSALSIRRVATTSTSAGVRVAYNEFNKYDATNTACLHLQNTDKALVGHNYFGTTPIAPISIGVPQGYNTGIYLDTVTNAQIKDNDFFNRGIGIFGTQDMSYTIYSCNNFDDCLIGLKFENGTVTDQDGSGLAVDNTWIDFCLPLGTPCNVWTQARIYADNLTSTFKYNFSGSVGSNKDPSAGAGILPSTYVVPLDGKATNSNCNVLLKHQDVSLENNIQNDELLIYPNPSRNYFNIQSLELRINYINIYNAIGEVVAKNVIPNNEGKVEINLPKGIYVLEIHLDSKILSKRVVII